MHVRIFILIKSQGFHNMLSFHHKDISEAYLEMHKFIAHGFKLPATNMI